MSKLKVLGLSCVLVLAALPGPAFAQYMFLDANGDGVWTTDDMLNPDTTTVRLWLDINHDKDGSVRTCNDHTGAGVGRAEYLTSTTSGSTTLRSTDLTRFNGGGGVPVVNAGIRVIGGGYPAGTTVTTKVNGGEFTTSAAPTQTGTVNLTYNTAPICQTTVGSPVITSAALFGPVSVGMTVTGAGIPAGTTVISIESTSSLTISANATVASNVSRTFSAGSIKSDIVAGSTTINAGLFEQIFPGMTVSGPGTGAASASPFIVVTKTNEAMLVLSTPATATGINSLSYWNGLDIAIFDVILTVTGGEVDFGTAFTPAAGFANTGQTEVAGFSPDATAHQSSNNYLYSQNGRFFLGYWLVTVMSGNPRIDIVDISTVDPTSFFTGFGTHCDAQTNPNYYAHATDWFDVDGVIAEGDLPPELSAPSATAVPPDMQLMITVSAHDPDSQPIEALSADLSALPPGNDAVFTSNTDNSTGTLTWTPARSDTGTYAITFVASNTLSSSAITMSTVEASVIGRTVRIQTPMKNCRVEATFFDVQCGSCFTTAYYSGDSGQVYVPLMSCRSSTDCSWWDRVRIKFNAKTTVAYWDDDGNHEPDPFQGDLNLYPESQPGDRIWNYTISADPWVVRALAGILKIHDYDGRVFRYTPPIIRLSASGIGRPGASFEDGIVGISPDSASYTNDDQTVESVLAHEYGHLIQDWSFGEPVVCCFINGNCSHPPSCDTGSCPAGVLTEGMAETFAQLYSVDVLGRSAVFGNCGPGNSEENITYFFYLMSRRDPVGWLYTYQHARFQFGAITTHVQTMDQFWSAWTDVALPGQSISVHAPGTWNASAIYQASILRNLSAVDDGLPVPLTTDIVRVLTSVGSGVVSVSILPSETGPITLSVFNVAGQLIEAQTGSGESRALFIRTFDLTRFPSGVYFIRTEGPGSLGRGTSKRVVIVR